MKKGSLIREAAFVLVFTKIFCENESCDELIATAKDSEVFLIKDSETENDDGLIDESDFDNIAVPLFKGVYDHLEELDAVISKYSDKRQIGRISKVSLAVLRLALYEINYNDKVPTNAAISEAVLLAKKYALESEVKFVNGVLGNYSRALEENK